MYLFAQQLIQLKVRACMCKDITSSVATLKSLARAEYSNKALKARL